MRGDFHPERGSPVNRPELLARRSLEREELVRAVRDEEDRAARPTDDRMARDFGAGAKAPERGAPFRACTA